MRIADHNQAHISVEQAVNASLREYLAEYNNVLLAEKALDELGNDQDELIDWSEANKVFMTKTQLVRVVVKFLNI